MKYFALCFFFIFSLFSYSQELKYENSTNKSWIPYNIDLSKNKGIVPEVINLILKDNNFILKPVTLSNQGADLAMKVGELDFDVSNPDWYSDKEFMEKNYVFSEPFVDIEEHVFVSDQTLLNSDITGKIIGTVRGYNYHNESEFNRLNFQNERELILALGRGKVDYVIVSVLPALYWADILKVSLHTHSIHSSGQLHFRFNRSKKHYVPQFNRSIEKLKSTGEIEKIIEKYIQ